MPWCISVIMVFVSFYLLGHVHGVVQVLVSTFSLILPLEADDGGEGGQHWWPTPESR